MNHLSNLQDLFIHELRDLYSAEKQLVTALPKMAQKATSTDLKEAFNHHLNQTRNHVTRLDEIFSHLGTTGAGKECEAMKGLIKEGEDVMSASGNSDVKDAALIAAAQRVEHYEIAGYGTVRTYEVLIYPFSSSLLEAGLCLKSGFFFGSKGSHKGRPTP